MYYLENTNKIDDLASKIGSFKPNDRLENKDFKNNINNSKIGNIKNNHKILGSKRNCNEISSLNSIKCFYTNCRSLGNKFKDLEEYILINKPDIIGLSETWGNNNIDELEWKISGYLLFRHDRDFRIGGGVLLYISNKLIAIKRENIRCETSESIWVDVIINNVKTLVGVIYRPPSTRELEDSNLREMLTNIEKETLVLMGDFNFSNINWKDQSAWGNGIKFLKCIQDLFFIQHVNEPTRDLNILDLVFTSEENLIKNLEVKEPLGTSDHAIITFEMNIKKIENNEKCRKNYFKGNYEQIKSSKEILDLSIACNIPNVIINWENIKNTLQIITQKYIPLGKSKKFRSKWITKNTIKKMRSKRKAWDKYKKNMTQENYVKYKFKLRKSESAKNEAIINFENKLAANIKKDNKSFYSYVNSKKRIKDKIGPLKTSSGEILIRNIDLADHLNKYFASVFNKENLNNIPKIKTIKNLGSTSYLFDIEINNSIVFSKMKNLKTCKSPGIDNIHPKLIFELKDELVEPLTTLFKLSLETGILPQDWKDANITALFKKGKKEEASNYRPISLTSIICKLLESIIKDQIIIHLEKHNLIKDTQHGFTKGRSCLTNLLEFFEKVLDDLDEKKPVDVIYLDFSKAFDKVPHQRLINKLEAHGIIGNLLKWITTWLIGRRQKTIINETDSDWREVISGVPQGSVLGPLLFVIFINDIDENIKSNIIKFADDTKIGKSVRNLKDIETMQKDLDILYQWTCDWQMEFNIDKCSVLHFGNSNKCNVYKLGNFNINSSESQKDLGIIISNNGKPSQQCLEAAKQANKTLGYIKRNIKTRDKDTILKLYKALVRPKLEYCVQAWNPFLYKDIKILERVQRRATKIIKGFKNLSYEDRLKKCKLQTLERRRIRGDLIETYKLVKNIDKIHINNILNLSNVTGLRGHNLKIQKQFSRLDIRKYSFSRRIVEAWNALPEYVILAESVNCFKERLDKYMGY